MHGLGVTTKIMPIVLSIPQMKVILFVLIGIYLRARFDQLDSRIDFLLSDLEKSFLPIRWYIHALKIFHNNMAPKHPSTSNEIWCQWS